MEIIFDENPNDTFQETTYPIINLETHEQLSLSQIQEKVQNIIFENSQNRIIIIKPSEENKHMHLFASLLGIEFGNNIEAPACAVFKIKDYKKAIEEHEPYLLFTTAVSYAYRLSKMNNKEMYRDIETLGYLGLDIKTDYVKNMIIIHHHSDGKKYKFKSSQKHTAITLACLVKVLSLMKIKPPIDITIEIIKSDSNTPINYKTILQKLFFYCRILFKQRKFY